MLEYDYFTVIEQYLTLVHVAGTLVEVGERRQVASERQHAHLVQLLMCRHLP